MQQTLFITRKFPPQKGGMETKSYNLTTFYPGEKKVFALKRKQIHLLWFLPAAIILAAIQKKDTVIHLGDALLCAAGYIPRILGNKVVIDVHGLDLTYSNKAYQFYLKKFFKADHIVANSTQVKKLAETKTQAPVSIIPPSIDTGLYINNISQEPKNSTLSTFFNKEGTKITIAGRLVQRKGVPWFLEHVAPELNSDFNILIVGDGPMKEKIEEIITEKKLTHITMAGKLSDKELRYCFQNSQITLLPNIKIKNDIEGFGIVAIESGSSGSLVVGSATGGIADALTDGENGKLFQPGNKDELIDILGDWEKYSIISKNAPSWNQRNFDNKVVGEKYFELFSSL